MHSEVTAMVEAIPDPLALVRSVYERATCLQSPIHGPAHWRAVARTGCDLIEAGERANPAVVFAFALIHDSQRLNDGHDPEHGARAAQVALTLSPTLLKLAPHEHELLHEACARHTSAPPDPNPTLGVCFDADRLDLGRVGIHPQPAYLSTSTARVMARRLELANPAPEWPALYERFTR